ncbi:MAG: hypothetical protein GXO86_02305 [Chlorobi bacterium]|nr:hypothetical protein [Chlorobiota bacterium]
MQRYVEQLIEDLEKAACQPPSMPFIEPPPHIAGDPVVSELALIPYRTIEEWSGIKQNAFPGIFSLSDEQIILINSAIFKLLESLHIELVDKPTDLPPEALYDIVTDNWDYPVQYLPSSGFDWELCTGTPETCPYGGFCNCGDELPDEEPPSPAKDDDDAVLPF